MAVMSGRQVAGNPGEKGQEISGRRSQRGCRIPKVVESN